MHSLGRELRMGENDHSKSGLFRNNIHTKLSDILDFGPDKLKPRAGSTNQTERLKKLIEQMKEINARVDKLTQRY